MKAIKAATCGLALGVLFLSLAPMVFAADQPAGLDQQGIKNVQQNLSDKGFYHGRVDGIIGSQTRASIREYQKSENLTVNGRLDTETASKLGVAPESVGATFKDAGQDAGQGGKDMGHEMKNGKPLAAGKEFGQEVGHAGKKVGQGVKKAVSTSDN
jgi:peptidoglycan hydrolase-like protein with peptidoglycan-binding domain